MKLSIKQGLAVLLICIGISGCIVVTGDHNTVSSVNDKQVERIVSDYPVKDLEGMLL